MADGYTISDDAPLTPEEQSTREFLATLLAKAANDPGEAFKPEAIECLAALRKEDQAAFESARTALKRAGCRVRMLDQSIYQHTVEQGGGDDDGGRKAPVRDRVVDAVLCAGATFWGDADGVGYATVPGEGGWIERYKIQTSAFRKVVRGIFGKHSPTEIGGRQLPGSIPDNTMRDVMQQLEAMAAAEKDIRAPEARTARIGNTIIIDLGDPAWRALQVTADGWRVIDATDAPLLRPEGLYPLPVPVPVSRSLPLYSLPIRDNESSEIEGIDALRRLLNLGSENDLRLVVAWLLAALWPSGPYAVLAIDGEQGSGKSTACRMLRRLVDPNKSDLRTMARTEDDLIIAAKGGRVTAFDNLDHVEPEMANAICRLATGAGLGKRKLYTDEEEHIVNVCRPVLINGIPSLLARGDLADRALAITLPMIPDTARKPEADVWAAFDKAAPVILAMLLDGMAMALRRWPSTKLPWLSRMADFTKLVCAAAPAFGWTQDQILAAIDANRAEAVTGIIEADGVAVAVKAIAAACGPIGWTGTASVLLAEINNRTGLDLQRERSWPKDAARLSTRLKRVAPALRRSGVEVVLPVSGGRAGRNITIREGGIVASEERDGVKTAFPAFPAFPNQQDIENNNNSWNADEADERSAAFHERSRNAVLPSGNADEAMSVPDNPLKNNDMERWNAGNAVLTHPATSLSHPIPPSPAQTIDPADRVEL